jgi:5'-nucleotidase
MNILLTNDDGIHHPGLLTLSNELRKKHRVIVVAPEKERSACSHNISLHRPVRFKKAGKDTYSSDGYPADCVKFSLKGFLDVKIDFVASGINSGPNMGLDVFYSGTVAGAREGLINKIPSAAFSLNAWGENADFNKAAEYAVELIHRLYHKYYKSGEMFNVNFPANGHYKGEKITKLGTRVFKEIVVKRHDPMGREYYWLGGEIPEHEPEEGSDFTTVDQGYISITPMGLEVTRCDLFNKLRKEHGD